MTPVNGLRSLMLVLFVMVGAMATHYLLAESTSKRMANSDVVEASGIAQLSRSVAWYAPRVVTSATLVANPAYPELHPIQRSDFVYAH